MRDDQPMDAKKMFPLEREIYNVIADSHRPLLLDGILRKITITKHASRVLMALRSLEKKKLVRFTADGWRDEQIAKDEKDEEPDAEERLHAA